MVVYPLRSGLLLLGTIGGFLVFALAAMVLVVGPSGNVRPVGVVAGVIVGLCGVWFVWGQRRRALILDGDRLAHRNGLRSRVGPWIELSTVRLVTDAPIKSSWSRRRSDALLWTPTTVDRRWSALIRRMMSRDERALVESTEAESTELYPFIVQYSSLRKVSADELHHAMSTMLAGVPQPASMAARPSLGSA